MSGRLPLGLEYSVVREYALDHGAASVGEIDEWVAILGAMDEEYLGYVREKSSPK